MAGGKGTRLTSITQDNIPKPMVNILGETLLEWQIENLKKYGINDICFVIGHLGEKIRSFFGDGSEFGIKASYIEEKEPLGTAGAFYYLKDWIKEESFFLIYGDVFFNIELNRMIDFHRVHNAKATLFVHPNSHPFDSDLVVVDSNSIVLGFDSKNNVRDYWYSNCVNAGFYLLDRSVCDCVRAPIKTDFEKEVLSSIIKESDCVYAYRSSEYIKDIGTVERITSTIKDIEDGFIDARCFANKQKCIFLDRDGTINKYKGLLADIDEFELEDTVADAIRLINHSEWLCIVITNQPVVARGMCSINDVELIHKKLSTLLGEKGAYLDDLLFCPHHPANGYSGENPMYKVKCHCRKPDVGMLEVCADRYNIDLSRSWIIGDTTIDLQTGVNAGMHKALVLTGEKGTDCKYSVEPDIEGDTLYELVNKILVYKDDMRNEEL